MEKNILGLDLGTTSIGFAHVIEGTSPEQSKIIQIGVRVNPLSTENKEKSNFEQGKSFTVNADRTQKRSARRVLFRYKLRRKNLLEILYRSKIINEESVLVETGKQSTFETWRIRGRVARSINEIVTCNNNMMRVVFQGKIRASKYLRAPIPLPNGPLKGSVKIKATLLYATACDAHHSDNYTRSGLEVTFRPHKDKRKKVEPGITPSLHPLSKAFFQKEQKKFQTEEELRRDAWKWENCLHAEVSFQGKSLDGSFFDIHYNARSEGHNDTRTQELEYALVITVEARNVADLYDQIVRKYATLLEPLTPVIDIPLTIAN